MLPMMFIDDCLRSVVEFMETPDSKLKMRTYNVTAMSFTPDEIVEEVRKYVPELKVTYEIDGRQAIGTEKLSLIVCSSYVYKFSLRL